MADVVVLFDGYSKCEGDHTLANCTCTLIKDEINVIVDTMTSWDGEKILKALKHHNISPSDIKFVVNTHGHSDHVGCNYLFPNATHIVGHCISHSNKYYEHDFKGGKEYIISDNIKIVSTPGHTLQDVTVVVNSSDKGVVAITGDLFEKEEDLQDDNIWKSAGTDSEELQDKNRKFILGLADWVVPGHGPMFKVDRTKFSEL